MYVIKESDSRNRVKQFVNKKLIIADFIRKCDDAVKDCCTDYLLLEFNRRLEASVQDRDLQRTRVTEPLTEAVMAMLDSLRRVTFPKCHTLRC